MHVQQKCGYLCGGVLKSNLSAWQIEVESDVFWFVDCLCHPHIDIEVSKLSCMTFVAVR